MKFVQTLALAAAALLAAALPASAEVSELRIAGQPSIGYLPFVIMQRDNLVEKAAAKHGMPNLKVTWTTFTGSEMMDAALLSNNLDIAGGGVPGLITIWDRTRGTAREVRGIASLSRLPMFLVTRNEKIKTIADFTENDRIALPGVKRSINAVALNMAAAATFGADKAEKLDHLTLTMSQPDAAVGLLSKAPGFNSVFSTPPYQYQLLDTPGIHKVLDSFDILGPHTLSIAWTTSAFRTNNPTVYKIFVEALQQSAAVIAADREAAIRHWLTVTKSTMAPELALKGLSQPGISWELEPLRVEVFADFMHRLKQIKTAPRDAKELFFPDVFGKAS